jgi:hypothetical protein
MGRKINNIMQQMHKHKTKHPNIRNNPKIKSYISKMNVAQTWQHLKIFVQPNRNRFKSHDITKEIVHAEIKKMQKTFKASKILIHAIRVWVGVKVVVNGSLLLD